MGLLSKYYWPKIDARTESYVRALRKNIPVSYSDNVYTAIMDDDYVICHRNHYKPWQRLKDWVVGRAPWEFRHIQRSRIKHLVFKMAYGVSDQHISKEYVIRKR